MNTQIDGKNWADIMDDERVRMEREGTWAAWCAEGIAACLVPFDPCAKPVKSVKMPVVKTIEKARPIGKPLSKPPTSGVVDYKTMADPRQFPMRDITVRFKCGHTTVLDKEYQQIQRDRGYGCPANCRACRDARKR